MRGTIQNKVDRETRFTNEFDQYVAEPGEALVSVYTRFAQLMNDLERNDMHFPIVTINTKFMNSLQPEWLKYQFKKLVNTLRAKKIEKSHDSLALVAHTGSFSKNTSSYYVTHPTFVVDYDDEYQQDDIQTNLEDPLVSAIDTTVSKLQTAEDLQGDTLLHYDAEIEVMNLIVLSIPNDIYNFVDACTSAKDMWKRVDRLMRGTIQNKVDRETHFTNKFDQFVAELGEALVSVYNHFAQLMNDIERNDMHFPIVTINTKFLNSLQPEWLKYVTQVRLAKRLTVDMFDDLFYYLQQFEKLVNTSRAKKL
nr:hypothetical protein [Tanacetum cinerariifolium]